MFCGIIGNRQVPLGDVNMTFELFHRKTDGRKNWFSLFLLFCSWKKYNVINKTQEGGEIKDARTEQFFRAKFVVVQEN